MLNHGREVSERTEQIIAKFWHKLRISLWKMMKGKQWRSLYRISLKCGKAKEKKEISITITNVTVLDCDIPATHLPSTQYISFIFCVAYFQGGASKSVHTRVA